MGFQSAKGNSYFKGENAVSLEEKFPIFAHYKMNYGA